MSLSSVNPSLLHSHKHVKTDPLTCHWLEVAILVTGVTLLIVACFAFSHAGAFTQMNYAIPLALWCLGIGIVLVGIDFIYRAIIHCKHANPQEIAYFNLTNSEENKLDLKNEESEKKHLPIEHHEKIYSPNQPGIEKLDKQLAFAILEGKLDQKRETITEFSIDLESDCAHYIDQSNDETWIGRASSIGKRKIMEDSSAATEIKHSNCNVKFFGVFDGHGEIGCPGDYLKEHLPKCIQEALHDSTLLDDTITNALTMACIEFDSILFEHEKVGGTTATFCIVFDTAVFIACVGDTRCVLVSGDHIWQLTEDADLKNERFRKSIEKMELPILTSKNNIPRIYGYLGVARALGSGIACRPKITRIIKDAPCIFDDSAVQIGYSTGDYLICASDGLWSVAKNSEVFEAVKKMDAQRMPLQEMAARLVQSALAAGSRDNIAVAVFRL